MKFFQDLGALVEQRWRDEDYCEELFPEIAERALVESAPHEHVDPWDIIRWVSKTFELPHQQDVPGRFGNPPITLYNGPRFYIDVYYWLDGTTSLHQHAFCGAFQVLLGSSIHSRYGFEEERKINAHFSIGQIALDSVNLLEKGDTKRILAGRQFIHSLFHLDRPSATITIRTRLSPDGSPQFDYRKPYFAIDPFYNSQAMIKKVQSAAMLFNMRHPETDDLISEGLSTSDFHTAFSILELAFYALTKDQLEKTFGLSTGKQRFEAYMETARRRHGEIVERIIPVIEEVERQHYIIQRRAQVTGSEHRFFLALLLNVPDRAKLLDLVRRRFADRNPVEIILDWVDELATMKMMGSTEPNVLGITDYDEDYLFAFQCLLEGKSLEQARAAFEDEFSEEDSEGSPDKLERLYDAIRDAMPFKAIFPGSSARRTTAVAVSS